MAFEPYIAELRTFAFEFAPRGWIQCNGQTLSIQQNQALFSLLGTTYGGNGVTNFAVPDLRGRFPVHAASGGVLPSVQLGEASGISSITLLQSNLPSHTHTVTATGGQRATSAGSGADVPLGNIPANSGQNHFAALASSDGTMQAPQTSVTVNQAGSNQPFGNMPPYLVMNVCIATQGVFPSRN